MVHYHLLGAVCWVCNNEALFELPYNGIYIYTTVSSNLDLLSHKDFFLPSVVIKINYKTIFNNPTKQIN